MSDVTLFDNSKLWPAGCSEAARFAFALTAFTICRAILYFCALLPHLQAGMSASEPNSPQVPVPDVSLSVQTSPHARANRKIAALMDEIEILKQDNAIAYAACQIRFALSSINSWRAMDGDFDCKIFWTSIVNFFEDAPGPAARTRVNELPEWWTRQVRVVDLPKGQPTGENKSVKARKDIPVDDAPVGWRILANVLLSLTQLIQRNMVQDCSHFGTASHHQYLLPPSIFARSSIESTKPQASEKRDISPARTPALSYLRHWPFRASSTVESFGTLAIRDDGAATFYGPSAGSESLLIGESAVTSPPNFSPGDRTQHPERLPSSVSHLSKSFPLAPVFNDEVDINYLIQNHLPPWHRARHLSELYLQQAPWFFGAVTKRQLMEENLPLWYAEASDLIYLGSVAPPATSGNDALSKGPHELALMFVIFCFGALTDHRLPPAPDNEEADMYFKLTRAALNLEPVLDRPPSVATIQTLALLAIYQGLCSGENSIESTWGIFGLATKLAQSIGLHRDCARWQLPPQEVQKRRALFWELFITDGWQSLATGRLATFYLPFVDCELPNDPDSTMDEDGSVLLSFPAWKARFGFQCISTVIQHAQTAKVPKYSVVIELDRKIRDMELPKYAQRPPREGAELGEAMKQCPVTTDTSLVAALLYVHRCFFAEAVSNNPTDPMSSPFAPSFLAGYRSACELISGLPAQFDLFPAQIARFWVMLSSVVTHASGNGSRSKIITAALTELRRAVSLFKEASDFGGRAGKFLPILERLLQKAEQAYSTATPTMTRRDTFSNTGPTKSKDELSIFSGQINKISTKAPVPQSSGRSSYSPRNSTNPSQPPPVQAEGTPPQPFSNIHPSLREQWSSFEGDLNAQLHNAQRDAYYTEDDASMVHASPEELHGMASMHEGTCQAQPVQHQLHPSNTVAHKASPIAPPP
ncbi:hypothetical protein P692DRAFT_20954353 [Suillus brevipes Sb2]|nr:hypothetical protein P692DRAFT_20954353 [Suillus brevipes Sb2]